ncbi:hypothetical protein PLESTB_001601200 [Pleodorina starrii]|uniref:F-box domain-containing protein n=1 Tax=Pleodorina starrii TaxID=330485 RepID=A0A9W6BZF0_9CHLO|nr:hypothetical protein PLESTB_001601200 [Pleodorina starrii]GLC69421.1 hypothetical protein PLESTF_000828100 [Pleodorina starrii]
MLTSAVAIRHEQSARGHSQISSASYGSSPAGSLPAFSPPSAYMYSGALGIAGASPPFRGGSSAGGDKANPYLAAKKFWKRLCFDPALDPTEYTIGFIETVQQPERKSGVEAWSMRLHDRLCELPYLLFVERFCGGGGGSGGGDGGSGGGAQHPHQASPGGAWLASQSTSDEAGSDVPYHRIAYFKHGNVLVWESEYHKRRLNDLPPLAGPPMTGTSDGGAGAGAFGTPVGDCSRRRSSRDGVPPMPAAGAGLLSFGGFTPPPRLNVAGGGGGGLGSGSGSALSGRSPRGASPQGSDDGLDGASSDDGELLLLEEEDEDDREVADPRVTAAGAAGPDGSDTDGAPPPECAGGGGSFGRRAHPPMAAAAAAAGAAAAAAAAIETPPPLPQLPGELWTAMLKQLGVRDVCMVGRTCRWLRQLAADPSVWRAQFAALWGAQPEPSLGAAVVRRMCRRSQLRAARWLEAHVSSASMGFTSTTCLQMDDTKVVSGDGNAVRLWEHATGRRIATLQGHPGRVTSVAFDDSLLVSGCAGAVVKLWSMDDLRCRRTLRGHDGAVTSCCLLPTGIPVSGGEDGLMRLWDVASGSAIVSLEAGQPVLAMQAHAASGHLVSAAGWGVQIWDVSTATLLHTLGAASEDDALVAAAAAAAGAPAPTAAQHPYTCVSYMGDLLAAGRQNELVLLDPRVAGAVGRLSCETGRSSAGGAGYPGGMGAIAAAAVGSAGGAAGGGGGRGACCVGVQMDEWKLVCGFNDGRHQLHLYDIRSLPKASAAAAGGTGGARRDWHVPLMTLKATGRINTFQFHEQSLLVGLEGCECVMWRFENPTMAASRSAGARPLAGLPPSAAAAAAGAAGGGAFGPSGGLPGGLLGPEGSILEAAGGGGGGGSARKEKKKPAKVTKKQTRYPKRNTK